MAPIRVGLIGLGASEGVLAAGKWAATAHLPSFVLSPYYELVAVCNSSVESARRSIAYHKLPATVKPYGSPEDLAADPGVDLISVSVNVGKHLMLTRPALLANKQVFVEWPLGASVREAEEMTALARERGLKTVVGLQMRVDPIIVKAKELIKGGAIGQVLSSEALLCPTIMPLGTWPDGISYYLLFESGGNEFHISFAHFLDAFLYVLGDVKNSQSIMKTQLPWFKTIDAKTGAVVNPRFRRTAPDHVYIQGELSSGAVYSVNLRKAHAPADGKGLRWIISGTEGELELCIDGAMLQMGNEKRSLRLKVGREGETKEVDWEDKAEPAYIKDIDGPGINTVRLFEEYAQGIPKYADFESALKLHQLLDKFAKDANFP